MRRPKPAVVGAAHQALGPDEVRLFAQQRPFGLILFDRNIGSPGQVRDLVADFRQAVELPWAPVFIDQEGGRVARLKPPFWHRLPPAALFGRIAREDFVEAAAALELAISIACADLASLGIGVNTIPVLDLPAPDADPVIGDRAYDSDPQLVARLGRVAVDASLAGGILPVIKHIPGHGRATLDSHHALPRVSADRQDLRGHDFLPFKALSDAPFAMTAHVVYEAYDAERPLSCSRTAIAEAVRGDIGFEGVLISDDIMMKALTGSVGERARAVHHAGCDLVLHCSGNLAETAELLGALPDMTEEEENRVASALARAALPDPGDRPDPDRAAERLEALIGAWRQRFQD
ncbi:MAG: beta-N-acetylhexosaminidase [Rhodothalassiaceae bacterium]